MRWLAVLLAAGLAYGADSFEAYGFKWTVPAGPDWQVVPDPGGPVLKLLKERPQEKPRRPIQFALADVPDYSRVIVEADVKRNGKSLIIVYAYKDEAHFNYAHISSDYGSKVPYHNGIFHVYGGDRVRISSDQGPPALPGEDWAHVKLDYNAKKGHVVVTVDGKTSPSMEAVDLSLGVGKVGIGSFFEKGEFRNVKIKGER